MPDGLGRHFTLFPYTYIVNRSTHLAQTPPRPTSDLGFNLD